MNCRIQTAEAIRDICENRFLMPKNPFVLEAKLEASFSNTSLERLEELSVHTDEEVRGAVASNPNSLKKILKALARDRDWGVRHRVAENTAVTSDVLVVLLEVENTYTEPHAWIIDSLFKNTKLPTFAKNVIRTKYEDYI